MHKKIAKITGTFLGVEAHGLLTIMIDVDYGGSKQGIGGYSFGTLERPTAHLGKFIAGVLRACGVNSWERLPKRTVYVLLEDDSWNAKAIGMENLPTEEGEAFLFSTINS